MIKSPQLFGVIKAFVKWYLAVLFCFISRAHYIILSDKIVDHSNVACPRCSNYIFIIDLTPGFNGLGKDKCKTRRETFKFWDSVWLIVCLFVSLLRHFWLIHFFHLRLLYQPYLGICQAPYVQSHQRQPMSAVTITACEVQVSAADSQTVPSVVTGVSKPLCCRLTLTFTLTSENLSLCTTLDSNYCRTRCRQSQLRLVLSPLLLHPRLLEMSQSDIPLFTLTWPAKYSPNQGWESTHRLHLNPLGGVFYSP